MAFEHRDGVVDEVGGAVVEGDDHLATEVLASEQARHRCISVSTRSAEARAAIWSSKVDVGRSTRTTRPTSDAVIDEHDQAHDRAADDVHRAGGDFDGRRDQTHTSPSAGNRPDARVAHG